MNIQLNLTRLQFDYIVQVLAQRPYTEVATLLAVLLQQSREQQPSHDDNNVQ